MYLVALRCLLEASAIDAEDARLHSAILHFRRTGTSALSRYHSSTEIHSVGNAKDVHAAVSNALDDLVVTLISKDKSSEEFNESFASRHPTSPPHILGTARGLLEIKRASDPEPSDTVYEVQRILLRLVDEGVPPSIPILLEAVDLLRSAGADANVISDYNARCRARLPLAWVFASDTDRAQRAAEREAQVLPNGKADV